jgi:diadenosine tetraphosphate (Ap4A) HIT family hydrolase
MIEGYYKVSASTISIQDGEDAGQIINHFHAHVIPRVKGDLTENDFIYTKLAHFDYEFTKEFQDLQSNMKNQTELKDDVEKFKEYLHKAAIF